MATTHKTAADPSRISGELKQTSYEPAMSRYQPTTSENTPGTNKRRAQTVRKRTCYEQQHTCSEPTTAKNTPGTNDLRTQIKQLQTCGDREQPSCRPEANADSTATDQQQKAPTSRPGLSPDFCFYNSYQFGVPSFSHHRLHVSGLQFLNNLKILLARRSTPLMVQTVYPFRRYPVLDSKEEVFQFMRRCEEFQCHFCKVDLFSTGAKIY